MFWYLCFLLMFLPVRLRWSFPSLVLIDGLILIWVSSDFLLICICTLVTTNLVAYITRFKKCVILPLLYFSSLVIKCSNLTYRTPLLYFKYNYCISELIFRSSLPTDTAKFTTFLLLLQFSSICLFKKNFSTFMQIHSCCFLQTFVHLFLVLLLIVCTASIYLTWCSVQWYNFFKLFSNSYKVQWILVK